MRTRVKICGITRAQDAHAAVRFGADALGFVFYEPSPRNLTPAQAAAIKRTLPPFVTTVGLFVDADPRLVAQVVDEVGVDLLQFHGDETPDACAGHGRPWIKAVRVRPDTDLQQVQRHYVAARALLLDSYRQGVPGGTGAAFDWDLVPTDRALPVILAGGLDAGNVGAAIARVRPYAVDVSGGVEASRGIKDPAAMERFINEVQRADSTDAAD
jgi:phosphoribosylanthranilate isomerase